MYSTAHQTSRLLNIFVFGLVISTVVVERMDARNIYELDLQGNNVDPEDYLSNPGNADLISDLASASSDYTGPYPSTCFCCRAFVCHRQKRCPCSRYFF